MATKTKTVKKLATTQEYDSVYFLKILAYLIISSFWITSRSGHRIIPAGLIIGILFIQHEKLQIDRKIEYAILLIGAVLGLVGIGISYTP